MQELPRVRRGHHEPNVRGVCRQREGLLLVLLHGSWWPSQQFCTRGELLGATETPWFVLALRSSLFAASPLPPLSLSLSLLLTLTPNVRPSPSPPTHVQRHTTTHNTGGGANTYDIPNGVTFGGSESGGGTALKAGGGGYVFMLQTHTWGSWIYEIADVDATGKNITFGAGGFQEARGGSGGCGTGAFYISHRQEMLDSPGEWYLDEKAGKLYTAVLPGGTPPATVVASNIEQLFSVSGASQAAAVKNVRISSLTLRHAAPTYMANYSVGSGGDYAVHRGGAISLLNTMNVTIDHNLFDGVGGNGVWLHAFNRYAMVTANEMRNMGENGIGMTGETVWVDGTAGDQPRFNTIEGNLIHHVGLYNKQACAVFHAVSCQNSVKENVFFHGPRALFNMNDAFGGDTRIVSNLFFKSMLETHEYVSALRQV